MRVTKSIEDSYQEGNLQLSIEGTSSDFKIWAAGSSGKPSAIRLESFGQIQALYDMLYNVVEEFKHE